MKHLDFCRGCNLYIPVHSNGYCVGCPPRRPTKVRRSGLSSRIRSCRKGREWRQTVIARDLRCVICDDPGAHADHIQPLSALIAKHGITTLEQAQDCSALWDVSNGRYLCKGCHAMQRTTPRVFRDRWLRQVYQP